MDAIGRRIVIFGITVLLPLFIASVVSITVAGIHSKSTCDIGNVVRMWKWTTINGIVDQFLIVFTIMLATAYAVVSARYHSCIDDKTWCGLHGIISMITYILGIFSAIWFVVGMFVISSVQGKACYSADPSLWKVTISSFILQAIAAIIVFTVICCNRITGGD